jgi:hypothetical protein
MYINFLPNFIFWQNNSVALTAEEFNSGEFKYNGLHEKHAVATWSLGVV